MSGWRGDRDDEDPSPYDIKRDRVRDGGQATKALAKVMTETQRTGVARIVDEAASSPSSGLAPCAVCKTDYRQDYAKCPECQGRANRLTSSEITRAVRDYKAAAERGDDGAERDAFQQVASLCGKSHAYDLARAVAARINTTRPSGKRRSLD